MKICLISHSNASKRQQDFGKALSQYADVLMLCPTTWGSHKNESYREGHFELFCEEVQKAGDMLLYHFTDLSYRKVKEFVPDVIYQQNDVQCTQPYLSFVMAKGTGAKYVQFCWENIKKPNDDDEIALLNACDLIIAGNDEAANLHGAKHVLPQVGIDIKRFAPSDKKEMDVLFLGRMVPEKGVEYIRKAYPETVFLSDLPYDQVPSFMASANVFVTAPYDIPGWKEQFAAYSSIEAMACGVPVVTTNTASVAYWLQQSPAILVPMKDAESLRNAILTLLQNEDLRKKKAEESRKFAEQFDNDVIAQKLINIFRQELGLS